MSLQQVPKDIWCIIASFLDYHAVCSLSVVCREFSVMMRSVRIWKCLYDRDYGLWRIGARSVHVGAVDIHRCDLIANACCRKKHYSNLELVPVKRQYANYKKAYARRIRTQLLDELRMIDGGQPANELNELKDRKTRKYEIIDELGRQIRHIEERMSRMLYLQRLLQKGGISSLFAWSEIREKRIRKKTPKLRASPFSSSPLPLLPLRRNASASASA
jgi:hypothetical protein